jgi:hypothetical protein
MSSRRLHLRLVAPARQRSRSQGPWRVPDTPRHEPPCAGRTMPATAAVLPPFRRNRRTSRESFDRHGSGPGSARRAWESARSRLPSRNPSGIFHETLAHDTGRALGKKLKESQGARNTFTDTGLAPSARHQEGPAKTMGWSRGGVGAPYRRAQGESAKGEIAVNAAIPDADLSVDAIPADRIQVQLERIFASDAFDASRRNRPFCASWSKKPSRGARTASRLTPSRPACWGATRRSIRSQIR